MAKPQTLKYFTLCGLDWNNPSLFFGFTVTGRHIVGRQTTDYALLPFAADSLPSLTTPLLLLKYAEHYF